MSGVLAACHGTMTNYSERDAQYRLYSARSGQEALAKRQFDEALQVCWKLGDRAVEAAKAARAGKQPDVKSESNDHIDAANDAWIESSIRGDREAAIESGVAMIGAMALDALLDDGPDQPQRLSLLQVHRLTVNDCLNQSIVRDGFTWAWGKYFPPWDGFVLTGAGPDSTHIPPDHVILKP